MSEILSTSHIMFELADMFFPNPLKIEHLLSARKSEYDTSSRFILVSSAFSSNRVITPLTMINKYRIHGGMLFHCICRIEIDD